jgi:hypothetical protein
MRKHPRQAAMPMDGDGADSRLGAGLGAAGLASGFAASHFDGVALVVWVVVRVLELRWVELVASVECRDDGLHAAVGGHGDLM